jgi:UDP-N-acetylmuramoyl-L-alanyl-D-glutamate--2,6-diaminopimelate ligase
MRIQELIKPLGIKKPLSDNFQVQGIACNSRLVSRGFVFVAIKGTRADGAAYIHEALTRGARAVVSQMKRSPAQYVRRGILFLEVEDSRKALGALASRFYRDPSDKVKVVGVTGTNGKTTITYLLEAILKAGNKAPAVIGTINYRFRNVVAVSKNTTPGAIELQSLLAAMARAGVRYAVTEVSSHALDQDRVAGVRFHSAIFTNITQDHLDYHKTVERYFQAKAKLFLQLQPGSFAVLNADDPWSARLKKLIKVKTITYGIRKNADVTARDITTTFEGTRFTLMCRGGKMYDVSSRLIGRYNVYNILAAVAWAMQARVPLARIIAVLKGFRQVPGRLEKVQIAADFSVVIDYAHTEDALANVLSTLRGVAQRRLIVVFGCGGERDTLKRPLMGKVATELSDYVILTSDNPRSEEPLKIIKDIQRGIRKDNYCVVPERLKAIKKSLCLARSGDIVVIAGKGHEDYQVIKDRVLYFDDREAVKKCLQSMSC